MNIGAVSAPTRDLDLSRAQLAELAPLGAGIIDVQVEFIADEPEPQPEAEPEVDLDDIPLIEQFYPF